MRRHVLAILFPLLSLACSQPEARPIAVEPGFEPRGILQTSIAFWPFAEAKIDEGTRPLIKQVYRTPHDFTTSMEARMASRVVPRAKVPSLGPADLRQSLNGAPDLLDPNHLLTQFQKGEGSALTPRIRQIPGLESARFLVLCTRLKMDFDAPLSVPNTSLDGVLSDYGLNYQSPLQFSNERPATPPTQVTRGCTSGSLELVILDLDKGAPVWSTHVKAIAESRRRIEGFNEVLNKLTEDALKAF